MTARLRGWLGTGALLLLLGLWAAALRPVSLGGPATYLIVRGDSMLPTYRTGDLVVLRAAPAYAVGQVVAYHVPGGDIGAGIVIVHRIVGGDGEAGYVLQGDNNPSPDPWRPRSADIAGTAWLYMPSIGRALALLHQPVVIGALAASLAVAWVFARPSKTPDCAPVLLGRRRRRRAIAAIVGE